MQTTSLPWGEMPYAPVFAEDETVTVQRRRRPTSSPGEREQAPTPQRRQTGGGSSSGGGGGYTGGGGGSSGGGSTGGGFTGGGSPIPGGKMGGGCGGLALVIVVVVVAIFIFPSLFRGGGDNQPADQGPVQQQALPTELPRDVPTRTPRPTLAAAAATANAASTKPGQTWTVMLYQDADDKVLEKDIFVDFNEAERIGSTDRVNVVSQLDRYKGGFNGDGDWTTTRRYHITQDNDLSHINSELAQDMGELNMSDGNTLVDFVAWAKEQYPADKYVLILSDHGMGWPGGWSDPLPGGQPPAGIPLASSLGDELYLMELDNALAKIQSDVGIDKFELIGMDACLMSHLEVFSALEPYTNYVVASQETEPALGWAYAGFLKSLTDNPDMSGADLSKAIVDTYIVDDQRIVDDKARAELVQRGRLPSAQQVAQQMEQDVTITALDMAALPNLQQAVDNLSLSLQNVDQRAVAKARSYAQSFTSIWGKDVQPSYIDLGNFAALLKETGGGAVGQQVDAVTAAIKAAVIAEKHGPNKPGSTGVSIYFPNSQLYRTQEAGPKSYTAVASRFAQSSLWDDFLAFFYTGKNFEAGTRTAAVPAAGSPQRAPGGGGITVSPITASAKTAGPGRPVRLKVNIKGDNVGYVRLLAGYLDQQANSINLADTDYLESSDTRQVDGVYYPVWPTSGSFNMQFDWEPLVFALSDGKNTVPALLSPETYGASFEDATYSVDGIYKFVDGEQRTARMYLRNGQMTGVFAFNNDNHTGAPWEVTPQNGDTFTVLDRWVDLDAKGNVKQRASQPGGTITFGDTPITWKDLDAAPGQYVVGFIVEDLDGNTTQVTTPITVE